MTISRKILAVKPLKSGCGTHHYEIKYQGEWDDTALINAIDTKSYEPDEERYQELLTKIYNFGGYVDIVYEDKKEDIYKAYAGVYYD